MDQLYTGKLYQFVQDHLQEDPALLLLKYHQTADFDLKEAVQQIASRQKAKTKLPTWTGHPEVVFPASLSLEQSSSEQAALFKARFAQGEKLIDLTGGFGVDTLIFGENFREVTYIEREKKLAEIVAHNFRLLSKDPQKYQVISTDSMEFLKQTDRCFDWLYIDPARRGGNNQKLFKLADCEPNVRAHWPLMKEKAQNIMIKASPMLDIKAVLSELPDIQQVLVVAVKNEVKEVLLIWKKQEKVEEVRLSAFDLKTDKEQRFDFTFEKEEGNEVTYALPQEFLIEPNAAIMKAGGFKSFALRYGLSKLHRNTHLYTALKFPEKIPGRIFKIIQEVKLDKKELKRLFPMGKVNVIVRNHPLKAEDLKKRYGLKDGSEDFLVATMTMEGKARVYWCGRGDEGVKKM
ncbi:MAG: class I SAM-dependent methyltransferase [Anditalea sp.]